MASPCTDWYGDGDARSKRSARVRSQRLHRRDYFGVPAGLGHVRFHYPFVVAAILVSLIALLPRGTAPAQMHALIAAGVAVGLLIGGSWEYGRFSHAGLAKSVYAGIRGEGVILAHERGQYHRMQASIPEGQTVLAVLEKPFLVDFGRNDVFIVDNPGSMAPAIPAFDSAEALATYMLGRSIRYAVYHTELRPVFPSRTMVRKTTMTMTMTTTTTTTITTKSFFKFQKMLEELGQTRQRVYDHGDMFVLDLASMQEESDQK